MQFFNVVAVNGGIFVSYSVVIGSFTCVVANNAVSQVEKIYENPMLLVIRLNSIKDK